MVPDVVVWPASPQPERVGDGSSTLDGLCSRLLGAPEHPVDPPSGPLPEEIQELVQGLELSAPNVQRKFQQLVGRTSSGSPSSRRASSRRLFVVPYLQQILKDFPSASQYAHALVLTRELMGTSAASTLISSLEGVDHLLRWGGCDVLASQELEDLCREAYKIEHAGEKSPIGLVASHGSQPPAARAPTADS